MQKRKGAWIWGRCERIKECKWAKWDEELEERFWSKGITGFLECNGDFKNI